MPWSAENLPVAFTVREAADAGVSRHRLNRAERSNRLWRPLRGIYVDKARLGEMPWPARHRALARVAPLAIENSVVSHVSAALLHGLPNPRRSPGPLCLTSADAVKTNRASGWLHLHRASLPEGHRTEVHGIPVTSVPRTVLDCFRTLPASDAVAIADHALRTGLVQDVELLEHLAFQHRWPGTARSRAGLALVDPRRESWFESASAVTFDRAGIEPPTPQVEVYAFDGSFLGRVDFLWQRAAVIGEADGQGKLLGHDQRDQSPEAVARRVIALGERSARLRETGLEIFHWSPRDLLGVAPLAVRRFHMAARRARPDQVRAKLVCACCHEEVGGCQWRKRSSFPTLYPGGARPA